MILRLLFTIFMTLTSCLVVTGQDVNCVSRRVITPTEFICIYDSATITDTIIYKLDKGLFKIKKIVNDHLICVIYAEKIDNNLKKNEKKYKIVCDSSFYSIFHKHKVYYMTLHSLFFKRAFGRNFLPTGTTGFQGISYKGQLVTLEEGKDIWDIFTIIDYKECQK